MVKKLTFGIILVIGIVWISMFESCSYNNGDVPEPKDTTGCDTGKVSWCNGMEEIILTHCAADGIGSCHQSGSAFGDFTTYIGVKTKVDNGSLLQRVVVQKDMPSFLTTGPALSNENRTLIETWITNNAPEE